MPTVRILNTSGLNLYLNPLLKGEGESARVVRAINVDSYPYGAKQKRPGYETYLGTPDISHVTSLFSWTKDDGTTMFTYRASGSALYYSLQGTGAWTLAGNGTITNGAHVGYAILGNTLIVGDGGGSTRHTTNGTAFTNTTLAPIGEHFSMFQNRIYMGGTSSTLFWSSANDATNWATSGTSDSSSVQVPGAGKINKVFTAVDRVISSKNSGLMYKWDGTAMVDMATTLGLSSPYSLANSEGYKLWLNRLGIYGYGGVSPQILSNSVQPQIYNSLGSGITGATFGTASGEVHLYDYFLSIGTVTDDITGSTVPKAILKYNTQMNEFLNFKFNNFPTAWHSYVNAGGTKTLIFGDEAGQCYTYTGSVYSDNGNPIDAEIEFLVDDNSPEVDKEWEWIDLFFNPGNEAQVMVSTGYTFTKETRNWVPVGDCGSGHASFRFPAGSRGGLLYLKIAESSTTSRFVFYGAVVSYKAMQK